MSWWTDLRDTAEKFETLGVYDPARNRQQERERQQINDQINAYKDQTNLTRQQLDQTRAEQDTEKRRIQEKQIRSLRRNYRAGSTGMLGSGQPANSDMDTNLGG